MSGILELTAERAVAGGRMLAHHEGRVVLVAGAIPGERVRATVERISRQTIWARVRGPEDVIDPSPDRREAGGDPACGGGVFAHVRYERQRQLKADIIADAFRRIAHNPLDAAPAVAGSAEHGYRMRSRLHVQGDRAGFYREGTHTLCDASVSGQLLPGATDAAQHVIRALEDHTGACEALVISENAAATERVIHLEPRPHGRLTGAFDALARIDLASCGLTGLTTVDGSDLLELAGDALVADTTETLAPAASGVAAVSWRRRPTSFFQGNRHLTGRLLERVLELAAGASCVDLYAGVGLFSVPMAARGARVIAVESDPSSCEDLELNAEPWREYLELSSTTVERWLDRASDGGDVIVVDPPRTGLSDRATAGIVRLLPPRVVYVSCDPATLARDTAKFVHAGYRLESLDGFDLFPNTAHVETVALFTTGGSGAPPPLESIR